MTIDNSHVHNTCRSSQIIDTSPPTCPDAQIRVSRRRRTPEKRLHGSLGDIPPAEFEAAYDAQLTPTG